MTKVVNDVTHTYYYAGNKLIRETYGDNTLDFFYNADGSPYALKYNGTLYYYITNLQGDVMRVVDADGNGVARYRYDPYGNLIYSSGSFVSTNPLRYRGYYFDQETGFYYLQSRYYDPEIGRFINADDFASTGQGILGHNMFAYCLSNPISYYDRSGYEPEEIVDVDGDGIADCYVYTYTYTTGIFPGKKQSKGYVYIFVGKPMGYFEDASNYPDGFDSSTDVLVGDYSSLDNPTMYVYRADLTGKQHWTSVLKCLLQYDDDFDTTWNRTLDSLLVEWREHKRYAFASVRARNVDFDNAEEGMGAWYYFKKAINAVVKG